MGLVGEVDPKRYVMKSLKGLQRGYLIFEENEERTRDKKVIGN